MLFYLECLLVFFLNYTNTPFPETLQDILKPIAKIALPAVLGFTWNSFGRFQN